MDYTNELIRLAQVTVPKEQPSPEDWTHTEKELGVLFPADFKALVSALGRGRFGIGLRLRNPSATSSDVRLSHEALLLYRQPISDLQEKLAISLYPQRKGLVAVGSIDRQDLLFREDATANSLTQLVWWDLDMQEFHELGASISQFLHDLYLGRIKEVWAEELRDYIWRRGTVPLFTP
jgi:hypothetical protein